MAKKRIDIPKLVREAVLKEYRHRCSICGADQPQLHHIDEDPSNNNDYNLLPLCPNCHLSDSHNPTAPVDSRKLRLFREYKDPAILRAKFHPLFSRVVFILELDTSSSREQLQDQSSELINFVKSLQMGDFYGEKLAKLLKPPPRPRCFSIDTPSHIFKQWESEAQKACVEHLATNRGVVITLVMELIRYQDWTPAANL